MLTVLTLTVLKVVEAVVETIVGGPLGAIAGADAFVAILLLSIAGAMLFIVGSKILAQHYLRQDRIRQGLGQSGVGEGCPIMT